MQAHERRAPLCVFAPAGTPGTIINQLNQEIIRALDRPDVKERFFNQGVEVIGASPEQTAAFVKSDMATIARIVKEAGIRVE